MDLRFTDEELKFRDEVRTFFKENLPPAIREKLKEGRHTSKDELVAMDAHPQQKGLGGLALAEGIWRHRLDTGAAIYLPR